MLFSLGDEALFSPLEDVVNHLRTLPYLITATQLLLDGLVTQLNQHLLWQHRLL